MKRYTTIAVMLISFLVGSIHAQQNTDDPLIKKDKIESYEVQELKNEINKVEKKQLDEQQNKYKLKIGGYFQIMYTLDETTSPVSAHPGYYRDPVYIRRARVSFRQQITDWVGFNITPEFAKCGDPLETTSTSVRVPIVELKGAYIDFTFNDYLNFRIGQFKQPFGFENVYSSARKIFPSDSVQYMKSVLPSDYDFGVQYSMNYKKMLSLQVATLNGTTNQRENNNKKDLSLRLVFKPSLFFEFLKGIEISGSYYDRQYGAITTSTVTPKSGQHYAAYLKLEREIFIPIFFTTEYVWGKNSTLTHDVVNLIATLEIKPFEKTFLKGLSPSFRYESYESRGPNADNEELEVYTFGLNYYPHKNVRILADYRIPKEKPSDLKNNRFNLMLQVSY